MVQTKDQYILVHRAVKELFQEQLKIIDSHPYANVDQDGLPFDLKKELEEPTYEVLDFKKPFVSSGNNSLRSDNEFQDVSGNNNNNNHITVSVSNVNVNSVKSSPPPLPPPSLGPSTTSPPVSSLSSSGETAPSSTPPATVEKSETRTQLVDKSRPSESRSSKKHSTKPSRPSPSPEKTREKKNSSGSSDSEATSKSASNNIRSALLRKPSMSKLKSLFERNPNKEERKPGQLSRAKSDVSTRFYNFTSFGQSRSNNASEAKETAEEGGKGSGSKKTESSSSATSNPKKPPILTKPTIPIKRSKSFKIHQQSDSSSTPIVPITNHVEKSRKKSDNSVSTSSTSSTTQSSSSHTFPSTSTSSPIKVCVKQVEIPKLQAVVSKSIKPEAQIAVTTAQEYDYDIDDRSHLCQKPISQSALQREALQKSSKSNSSLNSPADAVVESSNGIVGQGTKQSSDPQKVAKIPSSSSAFVKPEPPSRTHILKGNRYNNDYANVGFSKGRSRSNSKHKEMEDLLSRSEDRRKFEKLKKCDTVNPRILAASMGLAAPKQERPSLTRSHSHVWQADKTQIPIRIFSDENLHQSLTSTTNFTEKRGLTETNKFPSGGKPADNSEIFIQAIHPEVKSVSSSEYRRNEQEMEISSPSSTTPSAVANSKPIQRRRVPKTNPYANYPACITGSNTNFPYKIPLPTDDTDSYPVNHNDSHHRTGISNIPSLRPSHAGGGNSVGNSSDSSSNTGTPRNSSPGTPTQIVDSVYPKLFRNGRSNPITHESNDSSTPRTNGIINSNGREPKSILKESLASTPSESEEMLDTPRQFPLASSANLPKINTIRIAVGVRERRNSFRQAVWKEAQPASPPDNPIITEQVQQKMPPTSNGTFHQISEHSRIMSSNPFSSGYKTTSEVPKVHRNYEPIWPDPNSSSNVISNGGNNPFYTTSFSSDRTGEMGPSTSNPFTNFSANHLQTNSKLFTDPSTTARPNDPTIFQSKVDEIKVMLAELNSPVTTGDKGFSKEHGESSNSSIPVLKQHRSLRAPSRSHYQQGLSCFAFRKPSSYESIVDQLQHEENPPVKNFNDVTAQAEHSSRTANDYVTLGQCRTVDKVSMTNGFSTGGSSCSPEFAKKFSSQYRHHLQPNESSPSTTPVPPPRTRRNHDNHINVTNSFAIDYSNGNGRSSSWANSNANYSHLPPPDDPATAAASSSVNQNSKYSEPRDDFSNSNTEVNQNEKTLNSTSPKAIIRALGLFQAKAANIRSRLPNWGESKDRSVTKRPLENEASSGPCLDSTKPEENSSVQNRKFLNQAHLTLECAQVQH